VRAGAGVKGYIASLPPHKEIKPKKLVDVLTLLEWAFVREQVLRARDPAFGKDAVFRPRGLGGRDSTERIGAAVGTSMNLGFLAPVDAYAVLQAVRCCGEAALVRQHALAMSIPNWVPCPVVWSQPLRCEMISDPVLKDRKGRPLVVEVYPFAWRGDLPEIVAERRAVYRRWALGVAQVHTALVGRLADHALTDVLPPPEPWRAD
jgi:hypothetical protein